MMRSTSVRCVRHRLLLMVGFGLVSLSWVAPGLAQYRTAQEALNEGIRLHNFRRFAEAQAPLEAALELSDDPKIQLEARRALVPSYRLLPDIAPMLKVCDYIFEHSPRTTEKTLQARSLTAFLYERGKLAEAVAIYEGRLKTDPENRPALYALTEIYHRADPQPARRTELLAALAKAQQQDETLLAEKLEKQAESDNRAASAHYKDAAVAWQRAGQPEKALAALANAEAAGPDNRSELLTHFWHKHMADTYLELQRPEQAIGHYEKAIEKTKIDGYIKDCKEQLAKARAAAGM